MGLSACFLTVMGCRVLIVMFTYTVHVSTVAICCEVICLFGGYPDHCFSQSQGVQWVQSILVQRLSGESLWVCSHVMHFVLIVRYCVVWFTSWRKTNESAACEYSTVSILTSVTAWVQGQYYQFNLCGVTQFEAAILPLPVCSALLSPRLL